jgi:M6 family metalloprotease-like protein
MKKLLILLLAGLLWGCSASVVEVVEAPTANEVEVDDYELVTDPVPEHVLEIIENEPVVDEEEEKQLTTPIVLTAKELDAILCKTENEQDLGFGKGNIGFPLPSYGLPTSGVIKVGVVYLDFPDYRWNRVESTYELSEFLIQPIQDYFDAMSAGRVRFQWEFSDKILSLTQPVSRYDIKRAYEPNPIDIKNEIFPRLSSVIDYSAYDIILFGISPDVPEQYADVSFMSRLGRRGSEFYVAFIGMDSRFRDDGYLLMAHEFGHMFGIPDLYTNVCAGTTGCEDGTIDWREQFSYTGAWSLMSFANHPNNELLGWERWLMNWIDDEDVHCLQDLEEALIQIQPVFSREPGTKMIIVQLEPFVNLVIEMKEQNDYCQLCERGLLIYKVDTRLGGGDGPIEVLRPAHSTNIVKEDALLIFKDKFDSISTHKLVIQIIQQNDQGLIVQLRRAD